MSVNHTENSENHTENKAEIFMLGEVAEASALLRVVAEPRPPGDYSVKSAIRRAARRVSKFLPRGRGLSFNRAEDLWREEAKAVRSWEMDAIRRAAAAREQDARETAAAHAGLRALHQAYAQTDAEFFRPQMEAIERVLHETGAGPTSLGSGSGPLGDETGE